MSGKWWAIVAGCSVGAVAFICIGFWLFGYRSFLENLIAEAFGVAVGLAVIVWLVEGRIQTRQQRVRELLFHRQRVALQVWEISHLVATEIAERIAGDFSPPIDLEGHERGNWQEFKPLLRRVFRRAIDVPVEGLPPHHDLQEEDARSLLGGALHGTSRIKETIESVPGLARWEVLGRLEFAVDSVSDRAREATNRGLLTDAKKRYEALGELGESLLELVDSLDWLPHNTEVW